MADNGQTGNDKPRHDWTLLAIKIATPVMIGLVVYAVDARRQLAIQETLREFVTKEQFDDYVQKHMEFSNLQLEQINRKFDEIKETRGAMQVQLGRFMTQLNGVDKKLDVLIGKLEVKGKFNANSGETNEMAIRPR